MSMMMPQITGKSGDQCIPLTKGNSESSCMSWPSVDILRLRQNCCHFADNIFKHVFLNENVWILFKTSLMFVPKVWINNSAALVQIMACHRLGDKPLSEPMMIRLPTHICVTWPQWVNLSVCPSVTPPCPFTIMIHDDIIKWQHFLHY